MSYDPLDHDLIRGLEQRRAVLGDAWVERSLANATSFTADFQNLITRYAWHDIWDRPGLPRKTRRIIVLSITTALGRWEEYELHVRAALVAEDDSRLSPDELKEVLMQTAIYAGVPAANTAFALATKILREVGVQIGYELEPASPLDAAHPGVGREGRTSSTPALHYSVREPRSGKRPRHTVVLSHALGCDLTMWDALANRLSFDCRVVAYDHRGHGSSDAPPGPYSMMELADDAARLLRELDTGPVVWIGLSMGGMTGQELALRHPSLVAALVLANTTSSYPEAARAAWTQRIATVRDQGIEAIADAVMARYFHDAFRARHPATVARFRQRVVTTDTTGYAACCAAVGAVDTTARLARIAVPTLVLSGELDQGTPVEMGKTLAQGIPGATLQVIPDASHLGAIEQPALYAQAIADFLAML
jgi:3-oxoadipate enol-lactonase